MVETVERSVTNAMQRMSNKETDVSPTSNPYLEIKNTRNQIFISYSRGDSAWMREIRDHIDRLPDFQIDSWVDKNRMDAGDTIDLAIQDGLNNSTIALLLISPAFVESEYIQNKEIQWIFEQQKTNNLRIIFVPIFDQNDDSVSSKSIVEQYLEKTELNKSLSALSFSNPLDTAYERQDKSSREGQVKEIVNGVRRFIDEKFSVLEQTLENDYRIIGKVVEGASAAIYRARKEDSQGDFAIKVLKDPRDYDWFQRSLKKASHIDNINNIIPILHHRFRSSMSYCVLKFIEGERLSSYIQNTSPVSAEFTSTVLTKIGSAISQVREERVFKNVFFNIRPENILIEFDTLEPYLSLAGRAENRRGTAHLESLKRKAAKTTREAWAYVVPEYVQPQNHEPSLEIADQYLLGLMGYQMLSGHIPTRLDREDLLAGNEAEFKQLPSISEERQFSHLIPIVTRMININPKMRYPSLSEALDALKEPKKHSLNVVEASFRRCVRDDITADIFFDHFYRRLMQNSSEIKNIFTQHGYGIDEDTGRGRGIKWERQRQILSHSILLCLKYFEDQIRNHQPEFSILSFARSKHANEKISASKQAYAHFLEALLDTAKEFDPEWKESFHNLLWKAVFEPALDYMQR